MLSLSSGLTACMALSPAPGHVPQSRAPRVDEERRAERREKREHKKSMRGRGTKKQTRKKGATPTPAHRQRERVHYNKALRPNKREKKKTFENKNINTRKDCSRDDTLCEEAHLHWHIHIHLPATWTYIHIRIAPTLQRGADHTPAQRRRTQKKKRGRAFTSMHRHAHTQRRPPL